MKKVLKKIALLFIILALAGIIFFFTYANSLKGVNPITVKYYEQLKTELIKQGYKPKLTVISGKRTHWFNKILTRFGGAATKSQHLDGNAIDIFVRDINQDGTMNEMDVDIVSKILEEIIGNKGGIGTYKHENYIWNQQMVHFDCRGHKARWNR